MRAKGKDLSAINPDAYADRFLKFTKNTVMPNIDAQLDIKSKSNYISYETANLINLYKRRFSHDQFDDTISSIDSAYRKSGTSDMKDQFEQVFEVLPSFGNPIEKRK